MRHSDIKLTMNVYTDPALLDVRGALDALPALPLGKGEAGGREPVRATGTEGGAARTLAPTPDNPGQSPAPTGNPAGAGLPNTVAASGSPDKRRGPLTGPVSEPPSSTVGVISVALPSAAASG
jgi:hypothetical protein